MGTHKVEKYTETKEEVNCNCQCYDRQMMWECARGYCNGVKTKTIKTYEITKKLVKIK